jgi:DNA-binding transcriptional MerR regulator
MAYGGDMDGMRISELAERAGVSTSTVRYYERIGLVPEPRRTPSGYRAYDPDAQARLLFITRGKRMGLSLEAIAGLIAIWDGTNCDATKERLAALLDGKRAEIAQQIRELRSFETQLAAVQANIAGSPSTETCAPDLDCCTPDMPVACTLPAAERPERAAAFASLFERVVDWDRTSRRLEFRFADTAAVEEQIRGLTALESACCAFLSFGTRREADELIWEITAPGDEADAVLDELAAFIPASRSGNRPRSGN